MKQMQIEILTHDRMTQGGRALKRGLMNEHTPTLDLLVRESIQNSLDAAKKDGRKDAPVNVDFKIGEFKSAKLNSCLEGIAENLDRRYPDSKYKFLSVSDRGTQGLTGYMREEDVKDDNRGNLMKLVYSIGETHDGDDDDLTNVGGSWGIGKTIYFRVGIGLVFYYSRILENNTGKYESRLVGCYVEDETSSKTLIPHYKGKKSRGIAFWGNKYKEGKTEPITDSKTIESFLKIFGMEPYQSTETGTTIIMPYIDEKQLLEDNATEYNDMGIAEREIIPNWRNSIDEYLKIAVQRWYFPRLENKSYRSGKWLQVTINEEWLSYRAMLPLFKLEQALYNRAADNKISSNDFIVKKHIQEPFLEEIKVNNIGTRKTGVVAFQKVDKDVLGMCQPDNEYHPNINLEIEIEDYTKNLPILSYCRRPGMIVSYEQNGDWLYNVPSSHKDEFILAVFVLNSDADISSIDMTLERYARKGEMADHASWSDSTVNGVNPRIFQKIKRNTAKKIAQYFIEEEEEEETKRTSGLGKMLGKLILPPLGFGSAPSSRIKRGSTSSRTVNHKTIKYRLDDIRYEKDMMILCYNIHTSKATENVNIEIEVSSRAKHISLKEWEDEMLMYKPFEISSGNLKVKKIDGKKSYSIYVVDNKNFKDQDDILALELLQTEKESAYGIMLSMITEHECEMEFEIRLRLYERNVCPTISIK